MSFDLYLHSMEARNSQKTHLRVIIRVLGMLFALALIAIPSVVHSFVGFGISPVLTSSMQPAAEVGDAFITIHKKASDLKVGDIITLQEAASGEFFSHRIVEINEQRGFLKIDTRGDANLAKEARPFITSGQIEVPVSVMKIKWIGYAHTYLTSMQGRQLAVSLMVLANLVALFLFLFRKRIKSGFSKTEKVFRDLYSDLVVSHQGELKKSNVYKELYEQTYEELQLIKQQQTSEELQLSKR